MDSVLLVRFRPAGPWRIGPDSGARDQVDRILHSDTLFSAVCQAMLRLGQLPEWLAATVENPEGPAVRLSSCFPFLGELEFVVPPRSLWPLPDSPKVRWKGARFIPLTALADLLSEKPLRENRWAVDGASECLLPADGAHRGGPLRVDFRSHAGVDRLTGHTVAHRTACLEFAPGAGLWAFAAFASSEARERWEGPLKAAFRLLGDTGLGGERSLGWGRSSSVEFEERDLAAMLPRPAPAPEPEPPAEGAEAVEAPPKPATETGHWLLSVYLPGQEDGVDWQRGSYALLNRGGRVESPARWGEPKKFVQMVEEGSVVLSPAPPRGTAANVAPEGFPHPVFRAGFAVSVPISVRVAERASVTP